MVFIGLRRLSDLEPDPTNPRKLKTKAAQGLSYSLEEFGDLSGIVFNRKTGQLVSGHQRVKQLKKMYGNLDVKESKIVTPAGDSFRIRVVEWEEDKQKAANIAANSPTIQGDFTDDVDIYLDVIKSTDAEGYSTLMLDTLRLEEAESDIIIDDAEYQEIELEDREVKPPPKLTWVIIAVETEKFGDVAEYIEKIVEHEPRLCETSTSYR